MKVLEQQVSRTWCTVIIMMYIFLLLFLPPSLPLSLPPTPTSLSPSPPSPPPFLPPSLRVGNMCYCFLNLSQDQVYNQCPMDTFEWINDGKKRYPENVGSFSTAVMNYYEYFVYKMSSCQFSEEKIDSWSNVIICVKEKENKSNIENYFITLFHSHR